MSETTLIILIIAVVIGIVLIVYRDKLRKFTFRTKGLDASIETHDSRGVNITGVKQIGKEHLIKVRHNNASISNSVQEGEKSTIDVGTPN